MKYLKLLVALLAILMAMTTAETGWAHGGRSHVGVGVYVGGPWWPWYSPWPYYPPVVAVPVSPPPPTVYIEQQSQTPPEQSYWYYCNSSRTYYPYVQNCPEGWQRVMPRPSQ